MHLSIKVKLFLAILSAHIIVYAAMYSIGRYNFERGFLEYINRVEQRAVPTLIAGLEDFYEHTGSWETLKQNPDKWGTLIFDSIESVADFESRTSPQQTSRLSNRPLPRRYSSNDWYYNSEYSPARPYLLLLDADRNVIYGSREPGVLERADLHSIEAYGDTVGYLAVTGRQQLSEQADLLFSEQQKQSFLLFAVMLVLISALVAFPLASVLVRPIHDVVAGTRALIGGDYSSRIKPRSSDELGQLAQDFNMLAKTLEQNRAARQQWIADISHELRTPLAILRGELESLQDGIRPLSPESLDSLHHEVVRLNALVNDLHELSMSDLGALIYEMEKIDVVEVLEHSIEMYQQLLDKHGIELELNVQASNGNREIMILGDEKRIGQLFANLLQNTCRYTDKQGKLVVDVREGSDSVVIEWYDSAPGVSDKDLSRLFDRLYRVDPSRNRKEGGSGLGLAICKNIVEAHEGTIDAEQSPLGGLKINITFPRRKNKIG